MTEPAAPPPLDVLLARREWVRRFARTLARDDASADDLEQDAWLAAIERPPRHVQAPAGWLRRVLARRAVDVSLESRRRTERESVVSRRGAAPAADEVVALAEAHRRVVEAVLALDEPYRTTVLLRFFEDLPPREVAARVGVPVETVRSRVRRACERLRARLDEESHGERAAWLAPLLVGPEATPSETESRTHAPRVVRPVIAVMAAATLLGAAILLVTSSRQGDRQAGGSAAAAGSDTVPGAAPNDLRTGRRVRAAADEVPAAVAAAQQAAAPAPAVAEPAPAPHAFVAAVVDERGTPISDVRVRIDPAEMKDELDAVSDEHGLAQFEVVGAIRSAKALPHGADGRAWRPATRSVKVPAGADRVDVVISPGAWIQGGAQWDDGRPFEFAGVVAVFEGREVARVFADRQGEFEIAVPEEGAWDIVLTGMSHEEIGTTNTPQGRVMQVMDRGFGAIDGEVRGVRAGAAGVRLVARVPTLKSAMRVRVLGPEGRPLAGVLVRCEAGPLFRASDAPSSTTDEAGRCTIEDVPRARVKVRVATGPRDPAPWVALHCMPPAAPPFVRPGEEEVTLEFAAARVIRGRVEFPAEFRRRMDDERPSPVTVWVHRGDELLHTTWTDAEDRFVALAPAAATSVRLSSRAGSVDGRSFEAIAETVAPGADDVVLRLATNDPPPKQVQTAPSAPLPPK